MEIRELICIDSPGSHRLDGPIKAASCRPEARFGLPCRRWIKIRLVTHQPAGTLIEPLREPGTPGRTDHPSTHQLFCQFQFLTLNQYHWLDFTRLVRCYLEGKVFWLFLLQGHYNWHAYGHSFKCTFFMGCLRWCTKLYSIWNTIWSNTYWLLNRCVFMYCLHLIVAHEVGLYAWKVQYKYSFYSSIK